MLPIFGLLLACSGGALDTGDSAPVDPCADTPAVGWADFGDPFFAQYCRSCHSAGATDRGGAPDYMNFDAVEDVRTYAEAIRRATIEQRTMPVGGEVPEEELTQLGYLLACGI